MFRVGISLIPILILVTLLALNISIFGSDAILGASQVALLYIVNTIAEPCLEPTETAVV